MGLFDNVKAVSFGGKDVSKIELGGNVIWQKGLPSIYQQCAYVSAASKNGAYIDLGIVFDTNATTEIGYIYQGASANLQIFGAAENSGVLRYLLSAEIGDGINFYTSNGTIFFNGSYPTNSGLTVGDEARLKFVMKGGVHDSLMSYNLVTGVSKVGCTNASVYTMTHNLYLLGQNYNTGYRGNGLKQVTYFKHWDKNDTLVRDMIPCYRKSDSVIGMYDLVSGTFFTNAGTGTFTKGADV